MAKDKEQQRKVQQALKAERKADIERHNALKKAGEAAARKHRDETWVHRQINDALIENEKNLPWWRR
jgi:hypothetical protein